MYIYHITDTNTWAEASQKKSYDYCSLKTEGFIHCSTDQQYVDVANRLFKGRKDLLLLRLTEQDISSKVVYENLEGGANQFPHIYGPINLDAVKEIIEFKPSESGSFESVH